MSTNNITHERKRFFAPILAAVFIAAITFTLSACEEDEKSDGDTKTLAGEADSGGHQLTLWEFVYKAKFNDETIPVTVYVADNTLNDNGEFSVPADYLLHSLSFEYKQKKHRLQINGGVQEIFIYGPLDNVDWGHLVSLSDYNFDNYPDIAVLSSRGTSNERHIIFLNNPETKEYEHHSELSDMINIWADSETKTIKTYNKSGHAGMLYSSSEYKWEKEALVEIHRESQDYDSDLDKYIHAVRMLQGGKWVQQTDTINAGNIASEIAMPSTATFTDKRNGKTYKTVRIGAQNWMAENLNYEAVGSKCYDNKPRNCIKYGRLYDWSMAMGVDKKFNKNRLGGSDAGRQGVCPAGWHLPSNEEWQVLIDFAGGKEVAGKKLKAKEGWVEWKCRYMEEKEDSHGRKSRMEYDKCATDEFDFFALPGGLGLSDGNFDGAGSFGYWWSSSELTNINAYYRYMDDYGEFAFLSYYDKSDLFSVRCLKNN
jgi:uncharacterized protein (TIGR02145 family)